MTTVDRIIAWGDKTTLGIVYKAGPCPMDGMALFPPTKFYRADIADALAAALRSAQQSIADMMGVHGYLLDSGAGEILREVNAALAAYEARK